MNDINNETNRLHEHACERGDASYLDPSNGYLVFTKVGLLARLKCCGCGCRHCPFQHDGISVKNRPKKIQQPAYLANQQLLEKSGRTDALFWSGGKDSFLALRELQREAVANAKLAHQIILVTTFDAHNRQVAHQEISIKDIVRQAKALDLPLLGIPLHSGMSYTSQVETGLQLIPNPRRIAFGDLHLQHIRDWRSRNLESVASNIGAVLHYPIWEKNYEDLISDLEKSRVSCVICAAPREELTGPILDKHFTRAFINDLPDGIDKFGENGEFHTLVKVWEMP